MLNDFTPLVNGCSSGILPLPYLLSPPGCLDLSLAWWVAVLFLLGQISFQLVNAYTMLVVKHSEYQLWFGDFGE